MTVFLDSLSKAKASTSPRLDAEAIRNLPDESILRLDPVDPSNVSGVQYSGIYKLVKATGATDEFLLEEWVQESRGFSIVYPLVHIEDLASRHDIRFIRARRIACAIAQSSVLNRTKTVTRRMCAYPPKVNEIVNLTNKPRGPGVHVLRIVCVKDVRMERLSEMDPGDLSKEGFPNMSLAEFQGEFRKLHGVTGEHDLTVYRIEFMYLDQIDVC